MSRTQSVDRPRQEEIIADAIREQRQLVLTYNLPDGWCRQKAVFVSGSPASREALVQAMLPENYQVIQLPSQGTVVGGSFRLGHKKCLFSATVRSCGPRARNVPISLTWPDHLSQLQRRAYERATPPRGQIIAVRFWEEKGEGMSPDAREVRHGQLEDISAGGMRLKVADALSVEMEKTYKAVLTPRQGKPALLLDAILRHREIAERNRASLGFQFVGLETSTDGLRMLDRLARLVSQFQRSQHRSSGRPQSNSPLAGPWDGTN